MKEKTLYFFIILGVFTGFIEADKFSDFPVVLMVSLPFIIYFIAYKILKANEVNVLNFIFPIVSISASIMLLFVFYEKYFCSNCAVGNTLPILALILFASYALSIILLIIAGIIHIKG